jgi:hypothetical protein
MLGRTDALFGISDASPENLSVILNPLKMEGKISGGFVPRKQKRSLHIEIWGKSHMKLRRDTQFVPFYFGGQTNPPSF